MKIVHNKFITVIVCIRTTLIPFNAIVIDREQYELCYLLGDPV